MALKEQKKYCAFVDVLGYKNLVCSDKFDTKQKVQLLEDLYKNLFTASITIKQLNHGNDDTIFTKSFSDCLYFESEDINITLYTLYYIFNVIFSYNTNLPDSNYRPLLRAGLVHDWTIKVMDIGSLSRQPTGSIYQNPEYNNPIGLGVARAYSTSEFTKISGMRIIIDKAAMNIISLKKYDKVPFDCYYLNCPNYLSQKDKPEIINLFFLPIRKKIKGKIVDLFELCWPVWAYPHSNNFTDISTHISELKKRVPNFDRSNVRHLKKTAHLMRQALSITLSLNKDCLDENTIIEHLEDLKKIISTKFSTKPH